MQFLKKVMKIARGALIIFIIAAILNLSAHSQEKSSFSWYCKRAGEHKQPDLPQEFSFINDCGGYWIGSPDEKVVYLTFDAGYENGNVEKTLDVLKEKQVSGAFFVLLHLVQDESELVRRMAAEGHLVCNHTAHHKDMSKISDKSLFEKELRELEEAYRAVTGSEIGRFYRPPEGRFNRENLEMATEQGYKTVFWSFAYADWDNKNQPSLESAKQKILDNIHNGEVLLLHPTSTTNATILGEVIDILKSEGYRFGTLDELVVR